MPFADALVQRGWIISDLKLGQMTKGADEGFKALYGAIRVSPGQEITITGNDYNATVSLYVKSLLPAPLADGMPFDVCDGCTRVLVNVSTPVETTVPEDANYILIGLQTVEGNGLPGSPYKVCMRKPASIIIDGIEAIPVEEKEKQRGWIGSNCTLGQVTRGNDQGCQAYYAAIPVSPGGDVTITGHSVNASVYLYVKSLLPEPLVDGIPFNACDGCTREDIAALAEVESSVPEGAKYILIGLQTVEIPVSTGIAQELDRTPSSVIINGRAIEF